MATQSNSEEPQALNNQVDTFIKVLEQLKDGADNVLIVGMPMSILPTKMFDVVIDLYKNMEVSDLRLDDPEATPKATNTSPQQLNRKDG